MSEPARCIACGRLQRVGSGCDVVERGGRPRVLHGWEWRAEGEEHDGSACTGCGVVNGQFHHFDCDVARCASCGRVEHDGPCP